MTATVKARADSLPQLLVVGAGTMGRQIALQAALHSVAVTLIDVSGDQLRAAQAEIDSLLATRVSKGRISADAARETASQIKYRPDIADAAAGKAPDWVIEAVAERLEAKQEVFSSLTKVLPPSTGLATNSSHIRADTIAGDASWAPRLVNMHFFHPVLVMDLVEVVGGPRTDPKYVDDALSWAALIGRTAVRLDVDVDGFLVNRILGEASREAFRLVAEGVASFADVDVAVTHGLRWPLGPFQLADLSGLDVLCDSRQRRYELHGDEGDRLTVEVLRPLVDAGRLGRKSGAGFYDYSRTPAVALELPGASSV